MRKLYYSLTILFFCNTLSAQILNPDFEIWTTTITDEIDTWTTQGKVTKVGSAQLGSYAAKLETSIQGFTPTAAILALTSDFTDGYPYPNKIDTIKIWVKFEIANGDTGIFHAEQLNDTNLIRAGSYFFTTGTASTWTEIAIPMDVVDTTYNPLSILIYMSNTMDWNPQMSSNITVDNIRCYYKGVLQATLPNNSFETWNVQNKNDLTNWTTSNEVMAQFGLDSISCERTTDAQNGTFAVRIHTIDIFGTYIPGGMVTGANQLDAIQDPSNIPTFAVSQRYASLSGFLKFTKKGTDEGEASVYMFKNGMRVGEGHYYQSTTTNTYTLFEAKIVYDVTFSGVPDSGTVIFITSKDPQNSTGACVLFVDNIQLNTFALGVNSSKASDVTVYPNPFTNEIKVETMSRGAIVKILSIDGKEVISQTITNTENTINTAALVSGLYILKIIDGEKITTQKIVRQ